MVGLNVKLLALAVLLVPLTTLALPLELDLNEDGWVDYRIVENGDGFRNHESRLESMATNSVLLDFPLVPNAIVPFEPAAPAYWSMEEILLLRVTYDGSGVGGSQYFEGPLVLQTNVFFGLMFSAADGIHSGWIELTSWAAYSGVKVVDYGWQPEPGQPIRVGEKPEPSVPPENERITRQGIAVGDGTAAILWTRDWTNSTRTVVGRTVRLLPVEYELLGRVAMVDHESVMFALPLAELPFYRLIPEYPSAPAAWTSDTNGVLLLERVETIATGQVTAHGPLFGVSSIGIGCRRIEDGKVTVAGLHIKNDGDVAGVRVIFEYPFTVPQEWSGWLLPYFDSFWMTICGRQFSLGVHEITDIDGDGLIDFFLDETGYMEDGTFRYYIEYYRTAVSQFELLQDDGGFPMHLEHGVPVTDGANWAWNGSEYLGAGEIHSQLCQLNGSGYETYLGTRRPAAEGDGWVYGWLHVRSFADQDLMWKVELLGWSLDTRPGIPAVTGEPAPVVLKATPEGDRLVLCWNVYLPTCKLQSAPTLNASTWTDVPGVRKNFVNLPRDNAAGFYRVIFEE